MKQISNLRTQSAQANIIKHLDVVVLLGVSGARRGRCGKREKVVVRIEGGGVDRRWWWWRRGFNPSRVEVAYVEEIKGNILCDWYLAMSIIVRIICI